MMGFIILPLRGCHACLSLGLNKIGTHYEGRCSGISVLFANTIIVTVIFRIRVKLRSKVWVANGQACGRDDMWVASIGIPSSHWFMGGDILTDWGGLDIR